MEPISKYSMIRGAEMLGTRYWYMRAKVGPQTRVVNWPVQFLVSILPQKSPGFGKDSGLNY